MRVLEVACVNERQRSPTFRRVLNKLFRMYEDKGYRARSSGILDGRQLSAEDVDRAYRVIAVDGMVANSLVKRFGLEPPKLIQLSIPDIYERDSPALIARVERFYLSDAWK